MPKGDDDSEERERDETKLRANFNEAKGSER